MASEDRSKTHALIELLRAEPHRFGFFTAVRMLEAADPSRPRVGNSDRIAEDAIRFGQEASLAFAPSTLVGVVGGTHQEAGPRSKPDAAQAPEVTPRPHSGGGDMGLNGSRIPSESPPRLIVNFLGLLGANGPLPLHLTEYARDRQRNHQDPTLVRFLDIFNHRMLSLFYRAWAVGHQAVSYDRPDEDRFGFYVSSLAGYGERSLSGRDQVPDIAKRHHAPRLVIQTRNPEGLEAIISSYFGLPCVLEEFVGRWMPIPSEGICRLGESRASGTLGQTCIVGSRVWDVLQTFRLRIGPMGLADMLRFLPVGTSFPRLRDWVRSYCGYEFRWEAMLILKREEIPQTRLGQSGMLGWTTWLHSRPPEADAEDVILRPIM